MNVSLYKMTFRRKEMKKYLNAGMAALLALALGACSQSKPAASATPEATPTPEASAEAEEKTKAVYTIYNVTGETVTDLYIYDNSGSDKGENFAEGGVKNGEYFDIEFDELPKSETENMEFTVEFKTEGGYEGKFETLHWEVAPIALLAEDALTGPTQIAFAVPDVKAEYTVYNVTGEDVTELYLIDNATGDKGDNFAEQPLKDGESIVIEVTEKADVAGDLEYTLEFTTASGYTGKFETLHFEVAPISLLAEDALTGPTQISFTKPE